MSLRPTAELDSDDAATDQHDARVGTVVGGRYRLEALLGRGGMGTVYRARREDTHTEVAVKVLRRELGSSADAAERFEHEARATARLSHPACMSVLDFGRDPAGLYLVMELAAGQSLARLIAEGPLEPAAAARLADGLLAGLEHAHGLGVVHRDLKPENIMIASLGGEDGAVKILDFGIARVLEDREATGRAAGSSPGLFLGTPHYLSPEQALGEPGDARADLYAMGVLLFEMLTGKRPFEAPTQRELLGLHIARTPPRLADVLPDEPFPDALEQVVARALAKAPGERFASAHDFRLALARAVPEGVGSTSTSGPIDAPPPPSGRAPWTSPGHASPVGRDADAPRPGLADRWRGATHLQRGVIVAGALAVLAIVVSITWGALAGSPRAPIGLSAHETAKAAELDAVGDALARGDVPGARALAEQLVHDNPDDPRAFAALGHALFAGRDKQRGLAAYREAVRLDRGRAARDPELLANLRATFDNKRHGADAIAIAEALGAPGAAALRDFAKATRDPKLKTRALEAALRADGEPIP